MLSLFALALATAQPILVAPKADPEPKPVVVEATPAPAEPIEPVPITPVLPAPFTRPVPAKAKLEKKFKQRRLVQAQPVGEGTPLVVVVRPTDSMVALQRRGPGAFEFEPGDPRVSAWPVDPWLARDLDGNGRIDSGRELFGSFTMLKDGARAKHGFEALAELDDNGDGVVDARDAAFASLSLWYAGRGSSTIAPLHEHVVALELKYWIEERCDELGNCVRERARVWLRDRGSEGALVDLHLVMASAP